MTHQETKLMLLSIILCMVCAVLGAGDANINKLWIQPACKTDL